MAKADNGNRILRRWFPKGTDFSKVSPKRIQQVMGFINDCHRASFDGKTASQRHEELQCAMRRLALVGHDPRNSPLRWWKFPKMLRRTELDGIIFSTSNMDDVMVKLFNSIGICNLEGCQMKFHVASFPI